MAELVEKNMMEELSEQESDIEEMPKRRHLVVELKKRPR